MAIKPPPPPTLKDIDPGRDEYMQFYLILQHERETAVRDLARLYAALGVLSIEDALGKIREIKKPSV